jgi:hypothetical protein
MEAAFNSKLETIKWQSGQKELNYYLRKRVWINCKSKCIGSRSWWSRIFAAEFWLGQE